MPDLFRQDEKGVLASLAWYWWV